MFTILLFYWFHYLNELHSSENLKSKEIAKQVQSEVIQRN